MTGEAWLLVAVAAVAGYLIAKHGCGCGDHAPPASALSLLGSGKCNGPRGTCPVEIDTTSPVFDAVVRGIG